MVTVGDARVAGRVRERVREGGDACVAVRPGDLHPAGAGLTARVVSTEFHGDGHTGFARMADGTELVFGAPSGTPPGGTVHLAADPDRVLVFAS